MITLPAYSVATLYLAQETPASGLPVFVWIIFGILLVAVILGFVLGSRTREPEEPQRSHSERTQVEEAPPARFNTVAPPIPQTGAAVEETVEQETVTAGNFLEETEPGLETHDLTLIEGIGPVIMDVLHSAGIYTFQQLGQMSVDDLREILRKAGLRGGDPSTWPTQARLAADGRFDELKALQDELGKRDTLS